MKGTQKHDGFDIGFIDCNELLRHSCNKTGSGLFSVAFMELPELYNSKFTSQHRPHPLQILRISWICVAQGDPDFISIGVY